MNSIRRAGSARPSSLRAFFQENPSRCRAARMLSRHSRRSKRSCANATKRLSVQRGGGSAPAIGGSAAACWAVRIALPRAAAIRGQKGAAAAAPITQRRGAVFVVGMHPAHHRLRMAPATGGDLRRAPALCNLMQREKPLARARRWGMQRQIAQIRRRLIPAAHINT
jgi:hypothetical protein